MRNFRRSDINNGTLSHLVADDLFKADTKQVFDSKTGKFVGYLSNQMTMVFAAPEVEPEQPEILPPANPNQISLF